MNLSIYFLSYNIYDKDVVKGIYYVLTKMGFKVYVDFIVDPSMNRSKVTKETAQRIQSRLKHSKSLIYDPIIECSNEQMDAMGAGVVDGNTSKCFIMPIQKGCEIINSRQEYLLLYPVIGTNAHNELRVYDSEGAIYNRTLEDCLR